MPVQIQCAAVVIRNDALDRCLAGGAEEFGEIVPSSLAYSDGVLSQASFMSQVDAEQFSKSLELRGLSRRSGEPDFVMVHEKDQSIEPQCDWLVLFEFERRLIATMVGNESRKVIAPASEHDPDSMKHFTQEEVEKYLEFVERKGSIDTYRHKETGELVYHARHTETDEEIYNRVSGFVWKHHRVPGAGPVAEQLNEAFVKAIDELQGVAARNPESAKAATTLGAAWFAIDRADRARDSLERAHELNPQNSGILKELGSVVLSQNDFQSAVKFGQMAVALEPDNIDLLGNLAVGQLLAGEQSKALQTIEHALQLNSTDEVNQNVARIINDVVHNNRPLPESLIEMMKPWKPTTLWGRFRKRFK